MKIDLIIKPTLRCNFACTFCSSPDSKEEDLTEEEIHKYIKEHNVGKIIFNGGEPLLMGPQFFHNLLDLIEEESPNSHIGITSNLWAFYKSPDIWSEVFKRKRIKLATSFNYGEGRRISKTRNFSEEKFLEIMDLFKKKVGYLPLFISIITSENCHLAVDNVLLAKRIGAKCKVSPVVMSGRSGEIFPMSKMIDIYFDIYRRGLARFEINTIETLKALRGLQAICPYNPKCHESIRCIDHSGEYRCGSFSDDKKYSMQEEPFKYKSIKEDCLGCPAFIICNGCHKIVEDIIYSKMSEEECLEIKKRLPLLEIMSGGLSEFQSID